MYLVWSIGCITTFEKMEISANQNDKKVEIGIDISVFEPIETRAINFYNIKQTIKEEKKVSTILYVSFNLMMILHNAIHNNQKSIIKGG